MRLSRSENYGDDKYHGGPSMTSPECVQLEHEVGGLTLPLEKMEAELTGIHVDEIKRTLEFSMTYRLRLSDVNADKRKHAEPHRPAVREHIGFWRKFRGKNRY